MQFTLYVLVCIALTAIWVRRYSLSLKIYRKEETQMKVQLTCPDILAFEMNSDILYHMNFLNHKSVG